MNRYFWVVGLTAFGLVGCGGGSGGGSKQPTTRVETSNAAVIQTSGSGSSEVAIVDLDASHWIAVEGYYTDTRTDFGIQGRGEHFYRIGRYNIDTLTKVSISNPLLPAWQYSTREEGAGSANPYRLVFKDDSQGYVIRYETPISWQVNLDPVSDSEFKTGEIDLSAYDDGDGTPEAADGVVVGDRLYVVMQRLDRTTTWEPTDAYIAVFDTTTNTEIDLEIDPAGLGGIPLLTRNPSKLQYVDGLGLVVYSIGSYGASNNGGIEVVDLNDHSTRLLVDDDDLGAKVSGGVILSPTHGYLVGYSGWQNNAVYRFNPSTGEVETEALLGIEGLGVSVLTLDPEGRLWIGVGDSSNPHLAVVDPETDTLITEVTTTRTPVGVAFTQVETTVSD